MATLQIRQTKVCLWLLSAIVALSACAIANGWMVYTAAEVILPKQVISKTMIVWAHEFTIAALAIAVMFVGLELFAGGIAEQAYTTARAKGFANTRALLLGIVAALLIVLIVGLELGIVIQRALALQIDLDLRRPTLTDYHIKVWESNIARTRMTFTMITVATLCLTTLLTGFVVRGFREIGSAIGETVHRCWRATGTMISAVWSAVAFGIGVLVAFLVEVSMFVVAAVIFAMWVAIFVAGVVATWVTDILNEFLELIIRRPIHATTMFWHRLWTPTEIEDTALPPPAANPPKVIPPTPPSACPGTAATGTTTPVPVKHITAATGASQVLGTNGVATTTSSTTKHPEIPS